MRGSFACQVRQEDQTFAAGRDVFGTFQQRVEIHIRRECVAVPLQTSGGRKHDTHEVPHPRDGMTEGMQTAGRFNVCGRSGRKNHSAGAQGERNHTWLHRTHTHCAGGLIASTSHNRGAFFQSG